MRGVEASVRAGQAFLRRQTSGSFRQRIIEEVQSGQPVSKKVEDYLLKWGGPMKTGEIPVDLKKS